MNVRASACFVALLLLTGCPEKKETEEEETSKDSKAADDKKTSDKNTGTTAAGGGPAPVNPSGAATPAPTATGADTAAAPTPAAGIVARVKSEVDGKPDGVTGTPQPVSNALAIVQTPKDWAATTKTEPLAFKSADDKARVAVAGFGPEGPDAKIPATAAAAGLTNCQWSSPPEAVTAGKDKLPASVADGVCTRGAGQAKAAMMAVNGLIVVGSWDEGGDAATVFGVMRSVAKHSPVDPLAACCAAIVQNGKSAPPQQVGIYVMAAGACQAARKSPDGRKALAGVRAALAGANVPGSCR